ncbi:hypothetical protein BH10ACT2_BH10ACT2_01950 [soil metagenome]
MSSAVIIAITVAAITVLAAIVMLTAARRSDVRGAGALSRETVRRDKDAEIDLPAAPTGRAVERAAVEARASSLVASAAGPPVVWVKPDAEEIGVNRRQFLNRASVTLMSTSLGVFGLACIAFLWPTAAPIFGGKVNLGKLDSILSTIRSSSGFLYASNARSYVTMYPSEALPKARGVKEYAPLLAGMESGIIAMYQKCPHLGCRVPQCPSSQWFECPCHGSQYNRVGEKKGGPAPRGMSHFVITVTPSGDVVLDTSTVITGPPIGTNTTGQEAEGPHCLSGGGGHG